MVVLVTLLSAAAIFLVVAYLNFRWHYRHVLSAASKLPRPPALPLIGNAYHFLGSTSSLTKKIIKFTTQFKGLFCIWIGPVPVFVISDPSDVQVVLNSSNTLEKDEIYDFLKPYMGNGLLTAPVSLWKKYRRLLNPLYHPSNIEQFLPVFNDVSRQMVNTVTKKQPTDPKDKVFKVSIDAVIRTIFGRKDPLDSHTIRNIEFLFDIVGQLFVNRLFKVWLHIDWLFNYLYRKDVDQSLKVCSECLDVIDKAILEDSIKTDDNLKPDDTSEGSNINYFSAIHNKNPPSELEDHDWRHEITTIVVGATDTITSALSFLLITLANHPEVQNKVYEEIQAVVGHPDRDVTLAELNAMTFLGHVILESMRLHGSFPVILRRATKDTHLTKLTLPAGSRLLITLHAMGWDTDRFPEPHKFLPERFSSENETASNRHRYSFLPFSAGPRNCPGKTYAMLLMKTTIFHILRSYHLTSDIRLQDIEYEIKVVMFSKTPLVVKFNPRR